MTVRHPALFRNTLTVSNGKVTSGLPSDYVNPRVESILPQARPQNKRSEIPRNIRDKKEEPSGHEAFLKALEKNKAEIYIRKIDGSSICGRLKHSDKYTISVDSEESGVWVIFKHSIIEFKALTPRPGSKSSEQLTSDKE